MVLGRARLQRLLKNSPMQAEPWKSGPSGPRKPFRIGRASALVVALLAAGTSFPATSSAVPLEPQKTWASAPEVRCLFPREPVCETGFNQSDPVAVRALRLLLTAASHFRREDVMNRGSENPGPANRKEESCFLLVKIVAHCPGFCRQPGRLFAVIVTTSAMPFSPFPRALPMLASNFSARFWVSPESVDGI